MAAAWLALAAGGPLTAADQAEPGATADETPAAEPEVTLTAAERAANQLVEHFVRMYGEHLASPDWLARAMAVIGLAEIDDLRTTARLVEALETEKVPLVQLYAWEALFARRGSLSEGQRQTWSRIGKELVGKDVFHGDLRVGLLSLMAAEGPTAANKKVFSTLFATTSSLEPSDARTLWAMAETLARWKSPDLVKALITAMSNLDEAYRAEVVLSALESRVPRAVTLVDRGSKEMWEETQKAWAEWYGKAALVEQTAAGKLEGEGSSLVGSPEKIEDPTDPRWRKDLELRPLRLKQLDVVFAIDSTGSMGPVILWIERHVTKMMRALAIVSREPRIGLVFYRDNGDEYVVKPVPLTGSGEELVKAIGGIKAKGGGDVPEAVYEALAAAVKGMKWISERKVVIVVGDAPPHEETLAAATKLVETAVQSGYRFHFIKARTTWGSADLSAFDALAGSGQGSSTWAGFIEGSGDAAASWQLTGVAWSDDGKTIDREVVAAVLRSVLNEAYHSRVETFVNVLMEYVERGQSEKRKSFAPRPPPVPATTHTGPVIPPRPAPKPVDPQQR